MLHVEQNNRRGEAMKWYDITEKRLLAVGALFMVIGAAHWLFGNSETGWSLMIISSINMVAATIVIELKKKP